MRSKFVPESEEHYDSGFRQLFNDQVVLDAVKAIKEEFEKSDASSIYIIIRAGGIDLPEVQIDLSYRGGYC